MSVTMRTVPWLLLLALLLWQASASPALNHDPSHPTLSAVSELSSRLGARAPRLGKDPRLLPGPQDIEAIKKVAQILVMLGEQVIPAIIGEPAGAGAGCGADDANDAAGDPVD